MASEVEKGQEKFEEKHTNLDNSETEFSQADAPKKSLEERIKKIWQLLLKILELAGSILCFAFYFEPAKSAVRGDFAMQFHLEQAMIVSSACIAYMIINSIYILSWFLKEKIPFKTSAMLSVVGTAVYLVSGILLIVQKIDYIHPKEYLSTMIRTSTGVSFLNAILYTADAILTYTQRQDFQNYSQL